MNLNDLQENKKSKLASRVLRETFNFKLDLVRLDKTQCQKMLKKVRKLVSETRATARIHSSHGDGNYLKLMMLEQALSSHLQDLRTHTKIVVENEEVQKSQVILAAQDMIDSVQKMIEQISKMNVEELPAVVSGIENEIGANESQQFNKSAGEALKSLQSALETAKNGLNSSLGVITGTQSEAPAFDDFGSESSEEMPDELGGEGDIGRIPDLPEEPESEPENFGRERR